MTDLEQLKAAWPLKWEVNNYCYGTYCASLGSLWVVAEADAIGAGYWRFDLGSDGGDDIHLGTGLLPELLLTVKKALLEEAFALRQRLDALDEALSLLNIDGE